MRSGHKGRKMLVRKFLFHDRYYLHVIYLIMKNRQA